MHCGTRRLALSSSLEVDSVCLVLLHRAGHATRRQDELTAVARLIDGPRGDATTRVRPRVQ